ncbi:MAG: hypothetical protein FIA95_14025 [Gemmatimonadetes bacterium]|nr:hypothetical protein [Gemmatimonadota bacterium]
MTSITAESPKPPSPPSAVPAGRPARRIKPVELAAWVEMRLPRITQRWLKELQNRYDPGTRGLNGLLEEFLGLLASFLPGMLGPYRDQVEPLWTRSSELFGAVAAKRGLAAGEVIEEFQVLREVVLSLLYLDPPLSGRAPVSLREILRLNRAIDMGVTHASVGHTDALFFSLFEGSGIPDAPPTSELVQEVRRELEGVRQELRQILGDLPGTWAAEGGREP